MSDYLKAARLIEQQQRGREGTAVWMVGEQLKDICRNEPTSAELIVKDLAVPEMSLEAAEKKIKAYADSHKKGSSSCVPPNVAEDILRKFYGLPKPGQAVPEQTGIHIDLTDIWG